jgi:hypothetical protein
MNDTREARRLLGREHRVGQHGADEVGRFRLVGRAGGGAHDPAFHDVSSMVGKVVDGSAYL